MLASTKHGCSATDGRQEGGPWPLWRLRTAERRCKGTDRWAGRGKRGEELCVSVGVSCQRGSELVLLLLLLLLAVTKQAVASTLVLVLVVSTEEAVAATLVVVVSAE